MESRPHPVYKLPFFRRRDAGVSSNWEWSIQIEILEFSRYYYVRSRVSVYLRKGTNMFVELLGNDNISSRANFDLETGTTWQIRDVVVSSSIKACSNGWYRCSFVTRSGNPITCMWSGLVTTANAFRDQSTTLVTTIYVAVPQMDPNATFATSYIPTIDAPVTRASSFASIAGNNFSSWYNPVQGTFGSQF